MDYSLVLEKAGYKVLECEYFGSYSGPWAAILEDGGVIMDYYGSCSGCDALENFRDQFHWDHKFTDEECVEFCKQQGYEIKYNYPELLVAEKWDSDSTERANWLRKRLKELGFLKEEDENALQMSIQEEEF